MSSTRRGRKLAATIAGLAVVATGLTASPAPAAAEPEDSDTLVFVTFNGQDTAFVRNGVVSEADHIPVIDAVLEGDFSAAPGTDIFLHTTGGAPDGIIHVTPTGTSATSSFRPEVVNGYYPQAFVGDFDGNGLDDIFWYASGTDRSRLDLAVPARRQPRDDLAERHRRTTSPSSSTATATASTTSSGTGTARTPTACGCSAPMPATRSGRCRSTGATSRWSATSVASPTTATRSR